MNPINNNLDIIRSIVVENHHQGDIKDVKVLTKLVTLASTLVLKDVTAYIKGNKPINQRQVKEIKKVFENLKDGLNQKIQKKVARWSSKAHRLMSMLSRLRSRPMDLEVQTKSQFYKDLKEDYYQIMGCVVSYGNWKKGDEVLGAYKGLPNYQVHEVIKNKKGLQIVVLTPVVPKNKTSFPRLSNHLQQEFMRPILCCRGTEPTKTHNWVDDMHEHIGQYSFQDSKNEILRCLQEVSSEHKSAVITGHSLGGALAQVITGEFCDQTTSSNRPLIHSIYHYNAPGVGNTIAANYQAKIDHLPKNRKPKVMSYHHVADVVGLAGGAHLKADVKKELGEMSFSPQVVRKAHSWLQLISEFNAKKTTSTSLNRRVARSIAETFRQFIALIVQRILLTHITTKRALKTVAEEIASVLNIKDLIPKD